MTLERIIEFHARKVFEILIAQGGKAVWKYMEECYRKQFRKESNDQT